MGTMMLNNIFAVCALLLSCQFSHSQVLPSDVSAGKLIWKVSRYQGTGGRIPFVVDSIADQIARNPNVDPDWTETATTKVDGGVESERFQNGWAATTVDAQSEGPVFLTGGGFSHLFVNGLPFVGDVYGLGILKIVVPLRKGKNVFIVRSSRGNFSFNLSPVSGSCSLTERDTLVPDVRVGERLKSFGAVVIANHLPTALSGGTLEIEGPVFARQVVKLADILPYGILKPPFPIVQKRDVEAEDKDKDGRVQLTVKLKYRGETHTQIIAISVRQPGDQYAVTRLSKIDGSVQYYAVRPPLHPAPGPAPMQLTLHGAGVEANGQIGATYTKVNTWMVAPTNRRPFGFDWQEWGRMDALETLADFTAKHAIDPNRIYLTGHSMGGHGTWYLGALYPSLWAAIGPSSAWVSFFSYGGGAPVVGDDPLQRCKLESDTLSLLSNYDNLPIYAVHGTADDNVPFTELTTMKEKLKDHPDFHTHEESGAGHWYDSPDYPGAECMDYKPRNDFFEQRVRPDCPLAISFATQNPAVSSQHFWLTVLRQSEPGGISKVTATLRPDRSELQVTTENIEAIRFDLTKMLPGRTIKVLCDGLPVTDADTKSPFVVEKIGTKWRAGIERPDKKNPSQNGPFKLAFTNDMVWVYGTHGTPEENDALLARVRFEQETWWYRGNGNVLVVPDTQFKPESVHGRNIILYGNSETNTAFVSLLADCPISIHRNRAIIDGKEYTGDISAWFVYPRSGHETGLVGVVGSTSTLAIRASTDPRYFISGVSLPDYVLFGPDTLEKGAGGVLAAGYFTNDWATK